VWRSGNPGRLAALDENGPMLTPRNKWRNKAGHLNTMIRHNREMRVIIVCLIRTTTLHAGVITVKQPGMSETDAIEMTLHKNHFAVPLHTK
jgi:hypothetical protein